MPRVVAGFFWNQGPVVFFQSKYVKSSNLLIGIFSCFSFLRWANVVTSLANRKLQISARWSKVQELLSSLNCRELPLRTQEMKFKTLSSSVNFAELSDRISQIEVRKFVLKFLSHDYFAFIFTSLHSAKLFKKNTWDKWQSTVTKLNEIVEQFLKFFQNFAMATFCCLAGTCKFL